jgi:hypothetical protein
MMKSKWAFSIVGVAALAFAAAGVLRELAGPSGSTGGSLAFPALGAGDRPLQGAGASRNFRRGRADAGLASLTRRPFRLRFSGCGSRASAGTGSQRAWMSPLA